MQQAPANTVDPKDHLRTGLPRTLRPHQFRPQSLDPVITRTQKPLLTPRNLVLFAVIITFALYASGHLTVLDRFFDHIQLFGRTHNDAIVGIILHWLPIMLVGASLLVLGLLGMSNLRSRRRGAPVSPPAGKILEGSPNAAKEPQAQARVSLPPVVPRDGAGEAAAGPILLPAKPAPRPQPALLAPRRPAEITSVKAAEATPAVPPAAADPAEVRTPVRFPRSLSDSLPTLPTQPRVNRRDPRGTLPPAVAAALKAEVAAASSRS